MRWGILSRVTTRWRQKYLQRSIEFCCRVIINCSSKSSSSAMLWRLSRRYQIGTRWKMSLLTTNCVRDWGSSRARVPSRRRQCKVKSSLRRLKKEGDAKNISGNCMETYASNTQKNCNHDRNAETDWWANFLRLRSALGSLSWNCLDEIEIEHYCITKVHTVTKSESQHFVAAKHTMKTIKISNWRSRRPCTLVRPVISRSITDEIRSARHISCRRQVSNFFQAPWIRSCNCGSKWYRTVKVYSVWVRTSPAADSSFTYYESSSSKCQTVQDIGFRKSSRYRKKFRNVYW